MPELYSSDKPICEFPGLDFYRTPCKQSDKLFASNGSIIEHHRLEYRSSGRLKPTFSVCIKETIE